MSNKDLKGLLELIKRKFEAGSRLSVDDVFPFLGNTDLSLSITKAYETLLSKDTFEKKGKFITISGIDKSGKETQLLGGLSCITPVFKYAESLGFNVLVIMQPSYDTPIGSLVKEYLTVGNLDPSLAWMLWSLDRAQHVDKIKKWLQKDDSLILTKRWTESNVIYHKAKGVNEKEILRFEENIPKQDLTIVLDIKAETSLKRNEKPDKYENLAFLKSVRELYLSLSKVYPYGDVVYVDGEDDPCSVNFTINSVIKDYLHK